MLSQLLSDNLIDSNFGRRSTSLRFGLWPNMRTSRQGAMASTSGTRTGGVGVATLSPAAPAGKPALRPCSFVSLRPRGCNPPLLRACRFAPAARPAIPASAAVVEKEKGDDPSLVAAADFALSFLRRELTLEEAIERAILRLR